MSQWDGAIGLVSPLGEVPSVASPLPTASVAPDPWRPLVDNLLRIRLLKDDWDGQGAAMPNPVNVDHVLKWLGQMRAYPRAIPPARAIPGVAGEIYLEWQDTGMTLTAEVADPGKIEWTLAVLGRPRRHWVTDWNLPHFVSAMPAS